MLSAPSNIADVVNGPILFVTAVSVFFLVSITAVMVYFAIRYSRRRNPKATDVHGHTALEIAWTVIPTLLAFAMFWYGWVGYEFMKSPPADAMQVNVTARMWSWSYEYENGAKSDVLNIPVDKPVRLNLKSLDVIHSFYVPAFKVKQDAVPGVQGLFLWFTPRDTGQYDVLCAEYCGLQHSAMMSKVVVMSQEQFDAWLRDRGAEASAIGKAAEAEGGQGGEGLLALGQKLSVVKGCVACHSTDGSRLVGPSYKGMYGTSRVVIVKEEKQTVMADDAYLRRAILQPGVEVVDGYPPLMPSQEGLLTADEVDVLIAYIKSLE
jgi:cytochrome c oxidase subunit 2